MSRWRQWWPKIRAALIAAHVASIIILSIPGTNSITNPRAWETPNANAELDAWSERLGTIGYQTSRGELKRDVLAFGVTFGGWRDAVATPFRHYAELTGARQGWQMFTRPQKYPAELHIDLLVGEQWQPLVRPREPDSTWRLDQRDHNRVRKQLGRFARTFYDDRYRSFARWFAVQAVRDFPDATAVRVQLWRYQSPTPKQLLAGDSPEGHYEHELVFSAQELR